MHFFKKQSNTPLPTSNLNSLTHDEQSPTSVPIPETTQTPIHDTGSLERDPGLRRQIW